MIGLGTIVNIITVLVGGTLGLFLKHLLSEKLTNMILQGLALAVLVIGLSGVITNSMKISEGKIEESHHPLVIILSLAVGALIGTFLHIEERLDSFAEKMATKFSGAGDASNFSQGFVTTTLLFCVGPMAILGSLKDGVSGNPDVLYAKSALDGICAMIYASTFGVGVLFSAVSVALYQGSITLLAHFINPYLNKIVVAQMLFVGSTLIIGIALNVLKVTKIKIGNLLPAILIPLVWYVLTGVIP